MGGYSVQTSPLARRAGCKKQGSEVLIEKTLEKVTWVTTLSKREKPGPENYTTCLRSHASEWPSKDLNADGLT